MSATSKKIAQWIAAGKDPRSAHWQAGLEEILAALSDHHQAGRLVPVSLPDHESLELYKSCLASADLSPELTALFIPPPLADSIVPPDSADELKRIRPTLPAAKMLVAQPGDDPRILCAEVSTHAEKPGFDIFHAGALLGSFDYENQTDCIQALANALRAHLWKKERWQERDIRHYTRSWFEKVIDLGKSGIAVDPDHSYFHSPTLVRSNRVDVIFDLAGAVLRERFQSQRKAGDETVGGENRPSEAWSEGALLELLNLMRREELVDFERFSIREKEQFNNGFASTVKRLMEEATEQ
jgi:hypothetical protein